MAKPLNNREKRFCRLIVQGVGAATAARTAGYPVGESMVLAAERASLILRRPHIRDYIQSLYKEQPPTIKEELEARLRSSVERVREIAASKGDAITLKDAAQANRAEIETMLALARLNALLTDRTEIDARINGLDIVDG